MPITIICSSSGLQEAEKHSWGDLWGITGDTAVPHLPTPRAEQTLQTCFRVREETRLLTGMSLKMNLIQLVSLLAAHWGRPRSSPGSKPDCFIYKSSRSLPGSISRPLTVADHDWTPRMFRQHFCLLFAAEATWCMRLILCRQAATNLLG